MRNRMYLDAPLKREESPGVVRWAVAPQLLSEVAMNSDNNCWALDLLSSPRPAAAGCEGNIYF